MVPNITAILPRFTGEWAALLPPDAMLAACSKAGDTGWRDRVLTPVTTLHLFLLQILPGNTACRHLPHRSGWRFTAAAYGQARAKLPWRIFDHLLERFGTAVQRSTSDDGRWHGHRTCLVDGSTGSMPESACPPGRVRPINGAAAGVRRSRGPPPGAVPCGHRGAPEAGRCAPGYP